MLVWLSAGRATVLCPLTTDRGFFNLALDNADPFSISKGGTRLGDAIRISTKAFGPGEASKLIVLVTDGEDHDSYPLDEADKAKEKGISVVTVGFGSETGSAITMTDPETGAKASMRDRDGNLVNSKLDGETLRKIATKTEGVYIPAGVGNLDLKSIVDKHIKPIVRNADAKSHKVLPNEVYFPFVLFAFLSFLTFVGLSGVGQRGQSKRWLISLVIFWCLSVDRSYSVIQPKTPTENSITRVLTHLRTATLKRRKRILEARDQAGTDAELQLQQPFWGFRWQTKVANLKSNL